MPKTLLLADDSLTIRRVVELTFADEDVIVATVGDGRRAMARIASLHPDIVLADAAMSAPDGYDVAAFVKGTPELAHIPVILLTAAFQPIDEVRAKAAGCEAVLAKPFELTLLVARVKELLRAAEAANRGNGSVVGDGHEPRRNSNPVETPPRAAGAAAATGELEARPAAVPPQVNQVGADPSPASSEAGLAATSALGEPSASPAPDHWLEDLFDSIDESCSTPGTRAVPPTDTRLLPFLPAWDSSPAGGSALSIDEYFDLVDEATRRSQDGQGVAARTVPETEARSTDGQGEAAGEVDSVAAIFLSLLESSVVPPSPQHLERALRRLLGDE